MHHKRLTLRLEYKSGNKRLDLAGDWLLRRCEGMRRHERLGAEEPGGGGGNGEMVIRVAAHSPHQEEARRTQEMVSIREVLAFRF